LKLLEGFALCIRKINDVWEKIISFILVIFTFVMLFSILVQIIARIFRVTVIWTSDLATFLFVWIAFLGAAIAVKTGEHFVVDIFPPKWNENKAFRISLEILAIALQFIVGYVLLRYGIDNVKALSLRYSYALGIRLSNIAVVIPITGVLLLLGTLEQLLHINENRKTGGTENV